MSVEALNATTQMLMGNFEEAIKELKKVNMNRPKILAMLLDCYLDSEQFDNLYDTSLKILDKISQYDLHESEYIYLEKARDTIKSYKNNELNMDNRKSSNKSSGRSILDKQRKKYKDKEIEEWSSVKKKDSSNVINLYSVK